MLTVNQLRGVARQAGARDIGIVEIDVILTHLLQMFVERGLATHVAFKGGTMLRKMVFGPRGRLSTDLDFTRRGDISRDDLALELRQILEEPYRGLSFEVPDRDWYFTDETCACNPICRHDGNDAGVAIKLQISLREAPILPVRDVAQMRQDYFDLLDFAPAAIPSLAIEEAVAEKIRAASQRSKIRDVHDLSELSGLDFNRDLVRGLAVLKLWNSNDALNYQCFAARVTGEADYDIADLTNLLRRDQRPNLEAMIRRVVDGFRFLGNLTPAETALAADTARALRDEADALARTFSEPADTHA
ncbi:nucleotidyl transferase AbiEii/AbiGii toxin family protein [Hyphomicrobium sp.]|uniref:nucleotidyl transferase AbiEii/AbiGii toxin family protein n=1 Tax=Hyphomicrobium sp. TaxID=82 RepID=UPI000F9AA4A2|nr:nucleotidyl transferase AbiEii/AbiGii toxin family protein [Hyphomicrobium sp.]RUP07821.1 MAG: nucleotidyl transferase AbiEii/AbiGii toxin family protein [Hyphomicrobium sp.]